MKKLTTILLALTILAFSFTLTGCSNEGTFTKKEYSSKTGSTIATITIDVTDREIEVTASKDDEFHINYFQSDKEYYEIAISKDHNLTMTLQRDKEWSDFVEIKPAAENRKINLQVPNSVLESLAITTTNGNITLLPISAIKSISLTSNGGNIELEKANVSKELLLTVKNGNINGTILGSYDAFSIACEIKKGDCNLPLSKIGGEKSLKANCNNGDITLDFIK